MLKKKVEGLFWSYSHCNVTKGCEQVLLWHEKRIDMYIWKFFHSQKIGSSQCQKLIVIKILLNYNKLIILWCFSSCFQPFVSPWCLSYSRTFHEKQVLVLIFLHRLPPTRSSLKRTSQQCVTSWRTMALRCCKCRIATFTRTVAVSIARRGTSTVTTKRSRSWRGTTTRKLSTPSRAIFGRSFAAFQKSFTKPAREGVCACACIWKRSRESQRKAKKGSHADRQTNRNLASEKKK